VRTIYFDYNATTPLDPQVRAAMLPFLGEVWGNPSSIHHVGMRARSILDDFRDRAARFLGAKPSEIIFTSGGTESNNLAIFGAARMARAEVRSQKSEVRSDLRPLTADLCPRGHLITSAVEHHAALHCFEYLAKKEGFELTVLPVDSEGRVSVAAVKAALRPDTILVSVMAANNEIGTLQPVAEIGALCRERGVLFHTDAAQWFGKEPFTSIHQFNADLVSICAHKFHGPKGAGALFIRSPLLPDPIIFGGGHENERRAGTENLVGIAGLVTALENFVKTPVFNRERMAAMTMRLSDSIKTIAGAHIVGSQTEKLANTISFVVERTDSFALLAGLDVEGICASAGAACSAGSLEPSHVVSAIGLNRELARALVRFSLGRETTDEEVQHVASVLPGIVRRAQSGSS
jgi:cysteine desulfurase